MANFPQFVKIVFTNTTMKLEKSRRFAVDFC